MASLQNAQIDQSYQGLIKTADNTSTAPFPPVALQYGDGTDLPIKLGDGSGVGLGDMVLIQSGTKFVEIHSQGITLGGLSNIDAQTGTANILNGTFNFGSVNPAITTNVDFSNATVTGLPGGSPGLVNGTGTSGVPSLKVADSLVTNPATASAGGGIAIGDAANSGGADNFARNNIAIGTSSQSTDESGTAIGFNARAFSDRTVAIGLSALSQGSKSISIGNGSSTSSGALGQIAIGNGAVAGTSGQNYAIAIGNSAKAGDGSVAIGASVNASGGHQNSTVVIGNAANGGATQVIAIGRLANATTQAAIALGNQSSATATNAIALGAGVTASVANYTTTQNLQLTNYASLNYADDTAAAAGGVPLGGLYHNSGALRIRIS